MAKAGAKATVRSDKRSTQPKIAKQSAFKAGLLGGMSAGLTVNTCLFPLNTLKTRLQSRPVGAAMGFADRSILRGLYRGFLIDTMGTFPGTGLFMATYEVRVEANKEAYPLLLANGNEISSGELPGGRHYASFVDPFRKPSYLFACVAGKLDGIEDSFVTASGRKVRLAIWTWLESASFATATPEGGGSSSWTRATSASCASLGRTRPSSPCPATRSGTSSACPSSRMPRSPR